MNEMNDLIYKIDINYTNNSGIESSISVKFCDNGLKEKVVNIGNVCITEETIKGRVLSGRLDGLDGFCGYRYDYQNGETLININPDMSINNAISLINKKKMEVGFVSAELVLSSILRNDLRVVILNKGNLSITKTVSAKNEKSENCSLQEIIDLIKLDDEGSFEVQSKKRVYKIGDNFAIEESRPLIDNDLKLQLTELSDIIDLNPQNYKALIKFKSKIQKKDNNDNINEEKSF